MYSARLAFRKHPLLATAFALTLALTFVLGGRLAASAIYWSAHQQETIRPWMTIGYVGRSWGVHPRRIEEVAGLPMPVDGSPLTLDEIARQRVVPVEKIVKQVEAAVAKLKAEEKHD